MKEIRITYSELRVFSEKVMAFVRNETFQDEISLSCRIAMDCKIGGDDIDLFLYKFSTKFGVDFSDFDFEEHFYAEGEGFQFFPVSLIATMSELVFQILLLPFDKHGAAKLTSNLRAEVLKDKILGASRKDLMIKDL
ncbi:MAG: DUF1493 family protein, partial [Bacteroidota bacterium]